MNTTNLTSRHRARQRRPGGRKPVFSEGTASDQAINLSETPEKIQRKTQASFRSQTKTKRLENTSKMSPILADVDTATEEDIGIESFSDENIDIETTSVKINLLNE